MDKIVNWIKFIFNINIILFAYQELKRLITGRMIIHEVVKGLYQSSKYCSKDFETLGALKIGAIIDLEGGEDDLPSSVGKTNYKYWSIKDEPVLPDLNELLKVAKWGFNKWKGGKVLLVHCAAGHNRSGLVTGRILVLSGMNGKEAVALVQKKVPGALSNYVFREYLESL